MTIPLLNDWILTDHAIFSGEINSLDRELRAECRIPGDWRPFPEEAVSSSQEKDDAGRWVGEVVIIGMVVMSEWN